LALVQFSKWVRVRTCTKQEALHVFDHIQGRGQALGFGSVEELGSSQQKRLSMKRATAVDGA
jgi:hypothetical protein